MVLDPPGGHFGTGEDLLLALDKQIATRLSAFGFDLFEQGLQGFDFVRRLDNAPPDWTCVCPPSKPDLDHPFRHCARLRPAASLRGVNVRGGRRFA